MLKKHDKIVLVAAAVVCAAGWLISRNISSVTAQQQIFNTYEYATLKAVGDQIIFSLDDQEQLVIPPINPLSGNVNRQPSSGASYSFTTTEVRDNLIGALNIFGGQGWEAFAVTHTPDGTVILLKRPS